MKALYKPKIPTKSPVTAESVQISGSNGRKPENSTESPNRGNLVENLVQSKCNCAGCRIGSKETPCLKKIRLHSKNTSRRKKRRRFGKHVFAKKIQIELRKLRRLDNHHGPLALLTDLLLIIGTVAMITALWILIPSLAVVLYPIGALMIGSRQRALATLLHESSHGILMKNRRCGSIIGHLSGFMIFQTKASYIASHNHGHHAYTGDKEKDPDNVHYIELGLYEHLHHRKWVFKFLVKPLLGSLIWKSVKYLVQYRLLPPRTKSGGRKLSLSYCIFIAAWMLILIALAYFGYIWAFVVFWLVPYLTFFQVINYYIELSEHFPRFEDGKEDIEVSRNRMGNSIERFLTGIHGEYLHLEHHLDPHIPFWNQERARKIRMQDDAYRKIQERSGGIFTKRNPSNQTVIEELIEYSKKPQKN